MAVVDPLVAVVVVVLVVVVEDVRGAVLTVDLLDRRRHLAHTTFATNVEVRRRGLDETFALFSSPFRSWSLRI